LRARDRSNDRSIHCGELCVADSHSAAARLMANSPDLPRGGLRGSRDRATPPSLSRSRSRLLYLVMKHDYGLPGRGPSYEWCSMVPALEGFGFETRHFDYAQELIDYGYWGSQSRLRSLVESWRPNVLFIFMYQEQVDRELIRWVSESTSTVTVGWFADDHWRFDGYSRYWATALNWVLTTDASSLEKYRAAGQPNVLLSQWAANEADYHPTGTGLRYGVTFVGQPHGRRRDLVDYLRNRGIDVNAWGAGWPSGRVTQADMIEIFSSSRVNLNMSSSSARATGLRRGGTSQIKGRVFEVPACGGLLLSDPAPDLDRYFLLGREIAVYRSWPDLARQVRYLLDHEEERASIARAGYERTIRDHTWRRRFSDAFATMGVPTSGTAEAHQDER
jgi:spore maturation protein CgeB